MGEIERAETRVSALGNCVIPDIRLCVRFTQSLTAEPALMVIEGSVLGSFSCCVTTIGARAAFAADMIVRVLFCNHGRQQPMTSLRFSFLSACYATAGHMHRHINRRLSGGSRQSLPTRELMALALNKQSASAVRVMRLGASVLPSKCCPHPPANHRLVLAADERMIGASSCARRVFDVEQVVFANVARSVFDSVCGFVVRPVLQSGNRGTHENLLR
jgi:hypothetical protein